MRKLWVLILLLLFSWGNDLKIVLTIDDGPNKYMKPMLDILDKHDIKVIWFLSGHTNWMRKYKSSVQQALSQGHLLGNHTQRHDYDYMKNTGIYGAKRDLLPINDFIKTNFDYDINMIRYPYGAVANYYALVARDSGMFNIPWSLDLEDYKYEVLTEKIIFHHLSIGQSGRVYDILLYHCNKRCLEALPRLIKIVRDRGEFLDIQYDEDRGFRVYQYFDIDIKFFRSY